jgi:hypothetical protein
MLLLVTNHLDGSREDMTIKLKDNHPFMRKVSALFDYMQTVGVTIEVGSQRTIVIDNESGESYILKDIDGDGINNNMTAFPCSCEYKLIIDSYLNPPTATVTV